MNQLLKAGHPRWAAAGWLTFFVCVVATACGSPAPSGENVAPGAALEVVVRSLDEILEGSVTVTNLTPDAAEINVRTTKVVMCSVVYGLSNRYGNQSTDPDMGGQPHSDHQATLRALPPDTVIHYRIQGAAPDGTLYVSGDLTFRTPPGTAATITDSNLASIKAGARIAEVSSVFGSSQTWRAENAIDGDPRTEWSSQGDGDRAFLTIELPQVTDISAVGAWTRTMGTSAQIASIRVIGDGGVSAGPFPLPDASRLHKFPVQLRTRRLRFEVVSSSGGNAGFVEVGAFAKE